MKRLVLMRHAKAAQADPGMEDHARALSERGRGAAPRMGRWLADRLAADGGGVDVALVSTAVRTCQTLQRIASLVPARQIEQHDDLYLAEASHLLARVRAINEPAVTGLIVGHNTGLEDLARMLAGVGEASMRAALDAKFPTAAVAILTFDARRWRDVAAGNGTLVAFMTPNRLGAD